MCAGRTPRKKRRLRPRPLLRSSLLSLLPVPPRSTDRQDTQHIAEYLAASCEVWRDSAGSSSDPAKSAIRGDSRGSLVPGSLGSIERRVGPGKIQFFSTLGDLSETAVGKLTDHRRGIWPFLERLGYRKTLETSSKKKWLPGTKVMPISIHSISRRTAHSRCHD